MSAGLKKAVAPVSGTETAEKTEAETVEEVKAEEVKTEEVEEAVPVKKTTRRSTKSKK